MSTREVIAKEIDARKNARAVDAANAYRARESVMTNARTPRLTLTPVPPTKTKRIRSKKAIRNARNKAARAARRNNR